MSVVEYQVRFLTLQRFAPGSFSGERLQVSQFVLGLRINIKSVVATFVCRTLPEAAMRALDCEHDQVPHPQTGGSGQSSQ